jgi:hypothetical protein
MSEIKYPWQQAVMDAFLAHPEELAAKIWRNAEFSRV